MEEALLLIYPGLWIIMAIYGAKISRKGEIAPSFLCLDQAKMIQALACIGIIIHHVTQQITVYGLRPRGPVTIFSYIGFLFSGLFFFFSGYGLIASLESKPGYLSNFLQKRLTAVLLPFWIVNLCIVLANHFIYGVRVSITDALFNVFGITLINGNGWFIVEIVILYLIFYVLFSFVKNRDAALLLMCLCTFAIIFYGFLQGQDPMGSQSHWFKGEWWFNSTVTFAFGLIFARFKRSIEAFCHRFYPFVIAITMTAAVAFILATRYVVDHYGYYHDKVLRGQRDALITLMVQMGACLVVTLAVVLINMKVTVGNALSRHISRIQLPLFLVHGYMANRVLVSLEMSDFARYGAVLLLGIVAATAIAPLSGFMVKHTTDLLMRKRAVGNTLEAQNAAQLREKRNKRLRVVAAVAIVAGLIFGAALTIGRSFYLQKEFLEEIQLLRDAKVGDTVNFGRFETDLSRYGKERVSWIVIDIDGDKKCLLAEMGLGGSFYCQKHQEVTWEDSDLRKLINSGEYADMFSSFEAEVIIPVDGDRMTLLSQAEAATVFASDSERELDITDAAEKNGTNINVLSKANNWDMKNYRSSWWWLKGDPGKADITAPIVTVDGAISVGEKPVNKPGGAIRPAIWVDAG